MAIATGQNRDRAVARPPWVRRHDNQHEGVVAGIMLALVIIGIGVFLFWVPMVRFVVTNPWFAAAVPSVRPAEGAIPPGPAVVVSLDQPVVPSQASVDFGIAASADGAAGDGAASDAPANALTAAESPNREQPGVAEPAPTALLGPDGAGAAAEGFVPEQAVDSEAAAANDAAETARAAEAARAEAVARAEATAVPAATRVPTATPGVTATPRATPPAAPTTVAAATGKRARVVGTGGRGVVMYSAPRDGARQPAGVLEGAIVGVLDTAAGGWTRVQVDGGRSGWVRSQFLAPSN